MTIQNLYAAEAWEATYQAFQNVSFVSYDFDTVKQSLLDYIKLYYKESFNDFIETDELIAYVEIFAYVAEQLAYRVDITAHENFISTAERKQSILRLAKLVSYVSSRNLPNRGLVKITSISTTETVYDSAGNNLAGIPITWNDPNNSAWQEQFFLVINVVFSTLFGQPSKVFQVGDIAFQLYSFNNNPTTLNNGVFSYTANSSSQTMPMEIVPADLDANGPFERTPDPNNTLSVLYADDGLGVSSDTTGFMLFTKQGTLSQTNVTLLPQVPNQNVLINTFNINDTDVWVQQVDANGNIITNWTAAPTVNAENLYFSASQIFTTYEVESLENDAINVIFGDGNFSNIPSGSFRIWTRQSDNSNTVIQQSGITNQPMSLSYTSTINTTETCNLTFSLTGALQNASASEDIEHIRQNAPSTYYSQGRMVNGQDYNTFMLSDPSILRLTTINRTFAGQPKYIDWNDASGMYENVKLFGDDMIVSHNLGQDTQTSTSSSRTIIDTDIEPLLSVTGLQNIIIDLIAAFLPGVTTVPRTKFIENSAIVPNPATPNIKLQEKTTIQGLLDRHYYGEPSGYATINGVSCAIVTNDTDGLIWLPSAPTTEDGITIFSSKGNGLQPVSNLPSFGLHYNPTFAIQGNGTLSSLSSTSWTNETFTIEISSDPLVAFVTGSVSGLQPSANVGVPYTGVINFTITSGTTAFVEGDAFVVDVAYNSTTQVTTLTERLFTLNSSTPSRVNLSGQWTAISGSNLDTTNGVFDPNTQIPDPSWLITVSSNYDIYGNVISYTLTYRFLKLVVTSPTTNFWYNSAAQITDPITLLPVVDQISILKSNLNANKSAPLGMNDVYNVVGPVTDNNGVIIINSLEVSPLVSSKTVPSRPDDPLEFEKFASGNYVYTKTSGIPPVIQTITQSQVPVAFATGASTVYDPSSTSANPIFYTRTLTRGVGNDALDFMWQHFSPYGNLIDPSPSNIHDAYILTSGYYSALTDYLQGVTNVVPAYPTPLELRTSYATLLQSKMLSDTVVLHPAKIKLLFGNISDPTLRAQFSVVQNPNGNLTANQIRAEILSIINKYFSIDNWNFGMTFYATDLMSLIHQGLPLDVASVVIVPVFANNSFGSLFTIESGVDEILQSCAQLSDIQIVPSLSPSVLKQGSL